MNNIGCTTVIGAGLSTSCSVLLAFVENLKSLRNDLTKILLHVLCSISIIMTVQSSIHGSNGEEWSRDFFPMPPHESGGEQAGVLHTVYAAPLWTVY